MYIQNNWNNNKKKPDLTSRAYINCTYNIVPVDGTHWEKSFIPRPIFRMYF